MPAHPKKTYIREIISFWLHRFIPARLYIILKFRSAFGYWADLSHPVTFNEKLQWAKLYDHDPRYVACSDKHLVRTYVAERAGEQYLVPVLAVAADPAHIDFDALPKPYIVKSTHASGHVLVVDRASDQSAGSIRRICRRWLGINYYHLAKEWQYDAIEPKIIVEALLEDGGGMPHDYKFYCFGGFVQFIQLEIGRFGNRRRGSFDREWRPLPFLLGKPRYGTRCSDEEARTAKPAKLAEMIALAERLAQSFRFVRVDMYAVGEAIYVGELTFCPGSGFEPFVPSSYDKVFGDLLPMQS